MQITDNSPSYDGQMIQIIDNVAKNNLENVDLFSCRVYKFSMLETRFKGKKLQSLVRFQNRGNITEGGSIKESMTFKLIQIASNEIRQGSNRQFKNKITRTTCIGIEKKWSFIIFLQRTILFKIFFLQLFVIL